MSGNFQLVSDLIAEVQYRGDIQGQDDRHPSADLLRSFNDSARKLISTLTDMGYEWFLTSTAAQALSTTPFATGETYSEEDWPIAAARIYQIWVLYQTGFWRHLKPISLSGIRDYQLRPTVSLSSFGVFGPLAYALRLAPFAAGSTETVGKILIVPLPTVPLQFKIHYLPHYQPLGLTDKFAGGEAFQEYIVWDMIVKIASRDNDTAETYKIAVTERDRVISAMAKAAPRTQNTELEEPRNTDFCDDGLRFGPRELP